MEIFSKNDKVYRLIHHNYNLLPVLNRFGIQLGLKDKTVETICREKNINTDFFLAIVNTFSNEDYFPQDELISFSPLEIIEYLKRTHRYYLNYVVPKLDVQLQQLIDSRTSENQGLQMVSQFYKKYTEELKEHIDYEEKKVFPYIEKMVVTNKTEENYTIISFEKEHTNVDEKLNDLKNLIIKYLTPDYNENLCNEFLITLFRFERDIYDHARIEDVILLNQAAAIEEKLRK
jgi:regulator of cell morphogenesis and NO signaling